MTTTAIERAPTKHEMEAYIPPTPMSMIQLALQQGASVEVLRDLFKLKQEVEADEARKVFTEAFAAFKAESVRIVKNIAVTNGPLAGKKYADLFAVVDALTPSLSKHGLSCSWKLTKDEPQWIEVTCTLRHVQGYAESVSMGGPPDVGGAKNAIQARASAKTYLERYTMLAVTGMAAADSDTDGNAPRNQGEAMPEGQVDDYLASIEGSGDLDELQKNYFAARDKAEKLGDKDALHAFAEMKNKMYKKLAKGGRA